MQLTTNLRASVIKKQSKRINGTVPQDKSPGPEEQNWKH